jgi:hypothetical protein
MIIGMATLTVFETSSLSVSLTPGHLVTTLSWQRLCTTQVQTVNIQTQPIDMNMNIRWIANWPIWPVAHCVANKEQSSTWLAQP